MFTKKIVIGLSCAVMLSAITACVMLNEKLVQLKDTEISKINNEKPKNNAKSVVANTNVIKYDLYSTTPYDLPLYSIAEISKLPANVKKYIDTVLETAQGFYWLKYDEKDNKVFIILQNPISESNVFPRHNLEILEIFINKEDNSFLKTTYSPMYAGENEETINSIEGFTADQDSWVFDKSVEPHRPLKHTVYDDRGKIKFTEHWNYSDSEPIIYVMKNSSKKVVSILKETFENERNYRREHILYDKEGQTLMSLSISYDGANIARVVFYDTHNPDESVTIINEYNDSLKTNEKIYNSDYELLNTVKSVYKDLERKQIIIENCSGEKVLELNA